MTGALRLHPLNAVISLRKYLILLAIPILRGVFSVDEGLAAWVKGLWLDGIVVGAIVLLAWLRWKMSRLVLESNRLTYTRGLFWRTTDVFFADRLSVLHVSYPFYLRPFGAAMVQPETATAEYRLFHPILVSKREVRRIEAFFRGSGSVRIRAVSRPDPSEVALAAAASSNVVGGFAFALTVLSNTARYAGEQTANRFLKLASQIVHKVSLGLPPVVAIPLFTFAIVYLLEFLHNLAEYYRFSVSRSKDTLCVEGGLFARYRLHTRLSAIESVDLRCGLFARWFTGTRVYVNAAGFTLAAFTPAIIPSGDAMDAMRELRRILPELGSLACPIRVAREKVRIAYTLPPTLLLFAIPVAGGIAAFLLPPFVSLMTFWGVMASLAILWQLCHKIAALRHTGMGIYPDHLALAYLSRLRFHRVWIPQERVARITVAQTARQARKGICSVHVFETARRRRRHVVRGVDAETAREALERHGYPT